MKEGTGPQLIRQGAYTAVGTLLVYGVVVLTMRLIETRQPKKADCGCGCGGTKYPPHLSGAQCNDLLACCSSPSL